MQFPVHGTEAHNAPGQGDLRMIASYLTGELDEVYIYTRMANAANMVAEMQQLLPLKKASFHTPAQVMVDIHQEEIEMVPSAEEVLNSIVSQLSARYHLRLSGGVSYASRHNSRMIAMDAFWQQRHAERFINKI